MESQSSRRSLLAIALGSITLACRTVTNQAQEKVKFLQRGFFQRLLGRPATLEPRDRQCWSYANGRLEISMSRAAELRNPSGAIRLEGQGLPMRVLVVHGEDRQYHAFPNRCNHQGRCLDPVPGTKTVQCCSIGKSTYSYEGQVLYGPAEGVLKPFPVTLDQDKLVVSVT